MRKSLLLLFAAFPFFLSAQTDSSILREALPNAISLSYNKLDIFNGKEHLGYPSSYIGNAYYLSNDWIPGTILYRDVLHNDVFLRYDLVNNEVIIRHFNGYTAVALFTPRVQQFTLGGLNFVQFGEDAGTLPAGIYQELVKGNLSLYVKRSKTIKENVTPGGVEKRFVDKNSYYVLKSGVFYPIKKEGSLLDLIQDKRSEIKNHLKEKELRFRNDPEATLVEITRYYNQSNP
jgi:hypothetical protein